MAETHLPTSQYLLPHSGGNLLYDEGIKNLTEIEWVALKKLYLSFCHVGDEGALALSNQ